MIRRVAEEMGILLEVLPIFKQRFEMDAPEASRNTEEIRTIVACLDRMLIDYFFNPPKDSAEVEKFCEKHQDDFDMVPGETGELLFEFCSELANTFFNGPVRVFAAGDAAIEGPMDDDILYYRNLYALCAGDPIKTAVQFINPQEYGS